MDNEILHLFPLGQNNRRRERHGKHQDAKQHEKTGEPGKDRDRLEIPEDRGHPHEPGIVPVEQV